MVVLFRKIRINAGFDVTGPWEDTLVSDLARIPKQPALVKAPRGLRHLVSPTPGDSSH